MNDELKALLMQTIRAHLENPDLPAARLAKLEQEALGLGDFEGAPELVAQIRQRITEAQEREQQEAQEAELRAQQEAEEAELRAQREAEEQLRREAERKALQKKKLDEQYQRYVTTIDKTIWPNQLRNCISFMKQHEREYRDASDLIRKAQARIEQLEEEERINRQKEARRKKITIISVLVVIALAIGIPTTIATMNFNNTLNGVRASASSGQYIAAWDSLMTIVGNTETQKLAQEILPETLLEACRTSGTQGVAAVFEQARAKGIDTNIQSSYIEQLVALMPLDEQMLTIMKDITADMDAEHYAAAWGVVLDRAVAETPEQTFTDALCKRMAEAKHPFPVAPMLRYVTALGNAEQDVDALFPSGIPIDLDPMPYVQRLRANWYMGESDGQVSYDFFVNKKALPVSIVQKTYMPSFSSQSAMTRQSTEDNNASRFTVRFLPAVYLGLVEDARAVDLDENTAIIVIGQLYSWNGGYVTYTSWSTKNGVKVGSSTYTYYPTYTELDLVAFLSGDAKSVVIHNIASHEEPVTESEVKRSTFSPSTSSRMFGVSDPGKVQAFTNESTLFY